jgi:aminopeptidase N
MLRNYIGDSAFFRSLNLYLTTNKFKTAEADNLRLAVEAVTGQDMHWYWNQWYYGSGHPVLRIDYDYRDAAKKVTVLVQQTQTPAKIFRVPLAIDVYEGGKKTRHRVWLENQTDSFVFAYQQRPDLINVDGDKILLCEKKDNKTLENFIYQYKYAGLYLDRREAIDFCAGQQDSTAALALLKTAMKDKYSGLRIYAMDALELDKPVVRAAAEPILLDLAKNDAEKTVQAKAITLLGTYKKEDYKSLFVLKTRDSSYSVAGSALAALDSLDDKAATDLANEFYKQPARGALLSAMADIFIKAEEFDKFDIVIDGFDKMPMSENKLEDFAQIAVSLLKIDNTEQVKKAVDAIVRFRNTLPVSPEEKKEISSLINDKFLRPIADRKDAAGLKDQADYIRSKLN